MHRFRFRFLTFGQKADRNPVVVGTVPRMARLSLASVAMAIASQLPTTRFLHRSYALLPSDIAAMAMSDASVGEGTKLAALGRTFFSVACTKRPGVFTRRRDCK